MNDEQTPETAAGESAQPEPELMDRAIDETATDRVEVDLPRDPVDGAPLRPGESEPKGHATPKAPQNVKSLKVPGVLFRSFTGELDFGVVKRDSVGDVPLMQINAALPGGGVCVIEFVAAFTPQVIEGLKAAFVDWCESDPKASEDMAARARAAAAGIEVPVISMPGDAITSDMMRQQGQ